MPKKSKLKRPDLWSSITIHQLMIRDKLRTLSYKRAIENNVKNNDIVLDIGCGTGILSFFAAKKGCKKVYAIEKTDIIDSAIETAKLNSLEKYIEFIKGGILKFKPREKIDVLIHEQIGHLIWNENIISKVAYIRDNFLKKDGIIIPYKIDLYLVPSDYKSVLEKSLGKSISFYSRKKYGIDFSNLKKRLIFQNILRRLNPLIIGLKNTKTFLCKEKLVYTIDLKKETSIPREITASFRLKKNSKLTGLCGYFRVHLDKKYVFSTRPRKTNTHWGQIFLPCFEEKIIKRNSILNFTLFPKIKGWKFKFEFR